MSNDIPKCSPERLMIEPSIDAQFDPETGAVRIHATFLYEPWCCNGGHEIADAINTLMAVVDERAESAYHNRTAAVQPNWIAYTDSNHKTYASKVRRPEVFTKHSQYDWMAIDRALGEWS